ncbi:MAG: cold shock and DUF1294 domain-containing protein [Gammaproteobacteria bacterium]
MKGKVTHWNDEKGFGFITPQGGSEALFFHVSALKNRDRRPVESEWISYRRSTGRNGKPCAVDIVYLATLSGSGSSRSLTPAMLSSLLFLFILVLLVGFSGLPPFVIAAYLVMSLVTYLVYAFDKSAARRNARRISENSLHLLALAGGWPGALLAQQRLRHKTVKQPFRTLFWITLALNICALLWLLTPRGSSILNRIVDLPI